jgi:hypothetical protein
MSVERAVPRNVRSLSIIATSSGKVSFLTRGAAATKVADDKDDEADADEGAEEEGVDGETLARAAQAATTSPSVAQAPHDASARHAAASAGSTFDDEYT